MAYDRFLIAPINSGLRTDLKPWQIPEDAFTQLQNAYCFRGRIRKRFGSKYMATVPLSSRLGVQIGTTDVSGDIVETVPGSVFGIGQAFSIGSEIFTVYQLGTPALMYDTGFSAVYTYNTTTGAVVIEGSTPLTPVIFYPATPVMGLTVYEFGPINNQPSFAFDTQFAYEFLTTAWFRSVGTGSTPLSPIWHGTDLNFFWASNWSGITADQTVMFVTNDFVNLTPTGAGNPPPTGLATDDPIWAYSQQFTVSTWTPYSYSPSAAINPNNLQPITVTQTLKTAVAGDTIASYIETALIILPFKDRLIMLNTIENNATDATPYDITDHGTMIATGITPANYLTSTSVQYVNRCRYSINGSPFAVNAWLQPKFVYKPNTAGGTATVVSSGAGFIDAPTEEAIVSAEYIKDRLIVYFQESTWELVYTGNQILPFVWQKINTELGAEGTFSIVPFDKVVLGIGNVGVHACTGANVERIDNNIPDEIFEIKDKNEGVERVAGIRDYYTEMVYWTFPSSDQNPAEKYPNRILVFNYKTGAWAINDDCITAWGYFEQQTDTTWATANVTWENANFTWNSGVQQAQFRQIIAGNQQGWVYIVNARISRNVGVMQITNITYTPGPPAKITLNIINHTLTDGDYIYIENAPSVPNLNGNIYQISFILDPITNVADVNNVNLVLPDDDLTPGGVYDGGGTAARVSNIQIESKQLNPYVSKGRNVYLAKVDFCVEKTNTGAITVDYYPSGTNLSMVEQSQDTLSSLGNNILETFPYALYPLEEQQERLWHTIYFQTEGEFIQMALYFQDFQIRTPAIALSPFEIEGMIWHTMPTSARLQ
jgi:hypothetical protein